MLTKDYSSWQGALDRRLREVESELKQTFPDHQGIEYMGNDLIFVSIPGLKATIAGLHPDSDVFDVSLQPDENDEEKYEDLTLEEIVALFKNYCPPDEEDVLEVMENLKESLGKGYLLAGLADTHPSPLWKEASLVEYYPPKSWVDTHKALVSMIQRSYRTPGERIEAAWKAFNSTTSTTNEETAKDMDGEIAQANPDSPFNEAGGRYAQQAGAGEFGSFEVNQSSQWDRMTDEQLDEQYGLLVGATAMGTPEQNKNWFVKGKRWTVIYELLQKLGFDHQKAMRIISESKFSGKKVYTILQQSLRAKSSPNSIVDKQLLLERAIQYEFQRQCSP